jgi:hypothetical protein
MVQALGHPLPVSSTAMQAQRMQRIHQWFWCSCYRYFDYANTNKYKTVRAFGWFDDNGTGGYGYFFLLDYGWIQMQLLL